MFDLDTDKIQRLRTALLDRGSANQDSSQASESQQQASLERVAPFAETMFLMMMADGEAEAPELLAIKGALRVLTDGFIDDESLDSMIHNFQNNLSETQPIQRLQMLGSQLSADRQDRETAFALAAAVAAADNDIECEELQLIDQIAEWYGISQKRSEAILSGA